MTSKQIREHTTYLLFSGVRLTVNNLSLRFPNSVRARTEYLHFSSP